MIDEFFGDPNISPYAFVKDPRNIIGRVTIEKNVIIAAGCSVRADEGSPFRICKGSNLQDLVVLHGLLDQYVEVDGEKYSIYIGSHCSIAHRALVHGPVMIGKKNFIGFDAIIHKSTLGRNNFVKFQAVIENSIIGSYCHIGVGAKILNVAIGDKRYVPDGAIIRQQTDADCLPFVPETIAKADNHFNEEVVNYNKKLADIYRARRKQRSEEIPQ
jgi:carbonic anhydrase/acetyltransferase-like protein (isoleucine patch superfamily)